MATPKEGSYVRWQSIRIAQFGYVANLILTLAVASLGFSMTLLKYFRSGSAYYAFCPWLLAVVALLGSIAVGIWCALNRLHDFRETAQIARERERLEEDGKFPREEINARLEYQRKANDKRGELTWTLFYWQVGTYGAGIVFLVVAFIFAIVADQGQILLRGSLCGEPASM